MKIEAFLLCWNEIDILERVCLYYHSFCDKVTILDNHSTDGSQELAYAWNCEVVPFGNAFFDDAENMKAKNNCWRNSDADWVIVADMDELLYSNASNPTDSIVSTLAMYKDRGTTIAKTIGWQIMSDTMPERLTEITNGFRFDNYSKSIVFNPKAITAINYGPGAHECKPVGDVVWSDEGLMVLHYKHIGGVQRTIDRYKVLQKRLSKNNRKHGWGIHYNRTPASIRQEWNERMAKSRPLI